MRNGRPKKQENQIRNIAKNIRYSKEEWKIVQEKLKEIRNYLVDNNNRVFDVYTDVLDYIRQILSKNSDLVVKSNRTTGSNGGEVYSLDVVNLDAAQ